MKTFLITCSQLRSFGLLSYEVVNKLLLRYLHEKDRTMRIKDIAPYCQKENKPTKENE